MTDLALKGPASIKTCQTRDDINKRGREKYAEKKLQEEEQISSTSGDFNLVPTTKRRHCRGSQHNHTAGMEIPQSPFVTSTIWSFDVVSINEQGNYATDNYYFNNILSLYI